ncbi:ABC transporter ATP-binding protein [Streptomyces sp. NPDC058251]|uniref:ABC transporter ATP-binding protein n=1 Tax=Streptomyces sp. NPDC058251 TaxID=3346404 RepID=UPI0036F0575B
MTAHADQLAVDVRGLRKRYGDVTAVDDIDLGIRQGEVFGLLGPNGAGKSTTVEILQGNRDRDAGEVSVLGSDPATGTRAWRSRVGIVWQVESAPAELTMRETVRHFARYYPRPRDPEDVIGLVGPEAKADSRVKALSGGRRRRLDVALGVIGGPELLLLDEPTTGFDPAARRQFWDLPRAELATRCGRRLVGRPCRPRPSRRGSWTGSVRSRTGRGCPSGSPPCSGWSPRAVPTPRSAVGSSSGSPP